MAAHFKGAIAHLFSINLTVRGQLYFNEPQNHRNTTKAYEITLCQGVFDF